MSETTTEKIEKLLLSLNGVTRVDLPKLGLMRYLLHDRPFVVFQFEQNTRIFHTKQVKAKCREFMARYSGKVACSSVYKSDRWLQMDADVISEQALREILLTSYKAMLGELSDLSCVVYTEKDAPAYDIDFNRLLKNAKFFPDIQFQKKVLDLEDA